MGSTNKQIQRYEFTAVYTHPDAKVDIILVHGLNGDPQRTWTASNGVFWPSDLLPDSLKTEHANVLVYGYNADVYSSRNDRSASNNFIHHHAQSLIATLTAYRKSEGTLKNPIIWVVHSLGGILTKRALLYSNDVRTENHNDLRSVYVSTYGIIFLGTPHTGSGLATWGHMLQFMSEAVIPKKLFETEPVLIKTLRKDNETLQNINNHFLDIYQRFQIHMAHENHKTDLKGSKAVVVDPASASPQLPGVTYYGIESTHSGMCKFESNTAPGYRTVSTAIRDWVKEASNVIQVRWLVELDDRQVRQQLEIHERRLRQLGGQPANAETQMMVPEVESPLTPNLPQVPPLALTHDSTQSDIIDVTVPQTRESPLFIHPEPFRPNSYFVGRDEEMKRLHKMLMDRGKRAQGTSAVLIQCLPGGGKTHLARQYVFEHRDDYPGGVYWVRAKSQNETEYWYWRIAKNEALRGLVSQEDVQELRDPKKIVAIVRKWLNSLDNWLLVLDGVHFDDPGLQEFIPDAKNTSLIFTSTERAVIEDYRFDSPEVMELPLIAVQDATDLFLLEMGRKKPWTQDDRARALELVQLMGRLPLMIHVAAQQLKATREPLSKYLRSYKNRAQAGTLPAYKSVRDQLQHRGATSALNLISIVVFFDQHVPVEMLTLGMSALDNRTPLKTPDASRRKANLTNTLKVLIAFALLERTEIQDISPVSSRSSKQAFDRAGESLDILRIHSVVQQFFIDTLSEEKQAPFWLERAAAVWCRSFDEADKKIKEHSSVGLPDDYRRFAIHGRRLLEHVKRFEKRSPELLGLVKGNIEQRLDRTQSQIERLSQTLQTSIVEGSQEIPATSVFERTNSSSETDSLTPPSHSSTSTTSVLRDGDESPELFQSPTTPGADFAHNPYHFHVPYPQHQTIPVPRDPSDLNDDSKTVTGSPNIGTLPDGPPKTGENGHIRNDRHGSDWDFIVPNLNHRSVRKLEHNRYHDRGGSWRDTSISDPRVSISREIAKGSITSKAPRSQSTSRVTAGSEAELHLHRIRKSLPSSEDKPLPHERSVSSGSLPRPRFLMGNNVPAEALATKTPEDEYSMSPVEFSNSLAKIAAAPSSWTAATLKKLKENIQPTEPTTDEPNPQANLASSPAPLFAGSGTRSAGSSPASRSSPFTPPAPPPPLEVEINTTTSLRRGAHPTIRQWETHAYHPTLSRLDSSSLANFDTTDPMSFSYPSIQHPPPPTTHTLHPSRLAQVQLTSPGGYTSEPMSRNPSGGSAVSAAESANPPSSSSPFTASVSRGRRDSSSGGSIRNRLLPFLIPGWRRRRPSHTETEPSPRLGDAFGEVETSYSRWEERHHHNQMDDESVLASSQWTPVQPRDRGGGRSQSQSPAPRGRRGQQGATRGSGRVESDSRARGGSSLGGEAMARHGSGSGSGSGSGGLRLADGRVVEFGERRGSGNVRIDGAGAGTEIGRDSEKEEGLGLGISMEE